MSNEFVMVPRELLERCKQFTLDILSPQALRDAIDAELAKPSEQPQGEPVALKCWSCKAEFTLKERTDCDGCCWKCGVEIDLDSHVETFAKLAETAADQVVKLMAQLRDANGKMAERDALLRKISGYRWANVDPEERARTRAELRDMLSASAEPEARS